MGSLHDDRWSGRRWLRGRFISVGHNRRVLSRTMGEDNAPKTKKSKRTISLRPEPLHVGEDSFVFTKRRCGTFIFGLLRRGRKVGKRTREFHDQSRLDIADGPAGIGRRDTLGSGLRQLTHFNPGTRASALANPPPVPLRVAQSGYTRCKAAGSPFKIP